MYRAQQNSTKAFNVYMGAAGLTVTATLSKNGGSFNSVSPTITDRSNGFYSIAPLSAHRDTLGENAWLFSASGATSIPRVEQVGLVDPEAAAYGANTTAPDNAGIASAQASAATAATQSTNAATSAASADGKLTSGRLSRVDRLPDINAGSAGGLALVGSQMALTSTDLTALFADADVAGLISSIQALFDQSSDLPIQVIAGQAAAATLAAILADGTIATLISDAAAAKTQALSAAGSSASAAASAASADGKLTSGRLSRLDRLPDVTSGSLGGLPVLVDVDGDVVVPTVAGEGGGGAVDVDALAMALAAQLTGSEISVQGPQIDLNGRLDPLLRASDYEDSLGNAIRLIVNTSADLSEAEITFRAASGRESITGSGWAEQDDDVATKWHVTIELSSDETDKLPGEYRYAIKAILGDKKLPLKEGILPLRDDNTPGD